MDYTDEAEVPVATQAGGHGNGREDKKGQDTGLDKMFGDAGRAVSTPVPLIKARAKVTLDNPWESSVLAQFGPEQQLIVRSMIEGSYQLCQARLQHNIYHDILSADHQASRFRVRRRLKLALLRVIQHPRLHVSATFKSRVARRLALYHPSLRARLALIKKVGLLMYTRDAREVNGHIKNWGKQLKWTDLSTGQNPSIVVIGCVDSRADCKTAVNASLLGDAMVVRRVGASMESVLNAGQVSASVAQTLTYSLAHLGAKHVVAMPHTCCGAIGNVHKGTHRTILCEDADTDERDVHDMAVWKSHLERRLERDGEDYYLGLLPDHGAKTPDARRRLALEVANAMHQRDMLFAYARSHKRQPAIMTLALDRMEHGTMFVFSEKMTRFVCVTNPEWINNLQARPPRFMEKSAMGGRSTLLSPAPV